MSERELWQLGDDAVLAALCENQVQLNRIYADQLALLAELSSRNLCMAKGYQSEKRLLQDLLRISRAEAGRRLAHAAAVTPARSITGTEFSPSMPATAEALPTGDLGAEHIEAIRRAISTLPPEVPLEEREKAEHTLVEAARIFDPTALARLGRTLRAALDQDGRPPTDAEPRRPANELRWTSHANGTLELKGHLAPEGAALLTAVLSPLAKPRPAVQGEPDPRSRAERQGDALVDALHLAANSDDLPTEGRERPTLVLTMPLDSLRTERVSSRPPSSETAPAQSEAGQPVRPSSSVLQSVRRQSAVLDGAGVIDAGLARRLACDSAVIPVVLGARSEPLDIGRKTRVVPTAMRRALVLRDGGCAFPGCPVTARWCDAHHRIHWADGGPTALPNLVLLCGAHHDLVHRSDWKITDHDGRPEFIPPSFIDPARTPRSNQLDSGEP